MPAEQPSESSERLESEDAEIGDESGNEEDHEKDHEHESQSGGAIDYGEETAARTGRIRKHKKILKRRELIEEPEFDQEPGFEKEEIVDDSMGKFALYGVLILVLILLAWVTFFRDMFSSDASPDSSTEPTEPGTVKHAVVNPAEARDTALAFLNASTLEEKLKLVREPERVRQSVSEFYSGAESTTDPYKGIRGIGQAHLNGVKFARFLVAFVEAGRLLCVVSTREGLRVDWEAFVRFNPSSWEDLLSGGNPITMPFRVALFPGQFYSFEFTDQQKYRCYTIRTGDPELSITAYAERGSQTAIRLDELVRPRYALRCILKLRTTPESGARRQVMITGIQQIGWVQPDNPGAIIRTEP